MPQDGNGAGAWGDCHSSASLDHIEFVPPEEFIPGFLTPGLTVIAASPKAGKTWLCHEFALSIAQGARALGTIPCLRADVLCLFLEDSLARIKRRERLLSGGQCGCTGIVYAPAGTRWTLPRIGKYLDAFPSCRCIIVDTAERFKQQQTLAANGNGGSRIYSEDYAFWGSFQNLAMVRNVAVIVIHHDRKPFAGRGNGQANLDSVSGTRAITGSADHIWLLDRNGETGISRLSVVGRDLEERCVDYVKGEDGRLVVTGERYDPNGERDDLRQQAFCLRDGGASLRDIATALGVSRSTVSRWLQEERPAPEPGEPTEQTGNGL